MNGSITNTNSNPNSVDRSRGNMNMGSDLPDGINELSVNGTMYGSPPNFELVHESSTTRIFSNGELGIKVLIDSRSITEKVLLLHLELLASSSLPSSGSHRKALRVDTYQDLPALYFEWVDGFTVREWLRPEARVWPLSRGMEHENISLAMRLQVAMAITKAVCDFHDAGMFHGRLSLDDVILDLNRGSLNCSATLIDYSNIKLASNFFNVHGDEQQRQAYVEQIKKKDLNDLGLVLYSVLSNFIPTPEQNQDQDGSEGDDQANSEEDVEDRRNKRVKSQQIQPINDLPLYFFTLVSSLLASTTDPGGTDSFLYKSSRDVLSDLELSAQNPALLKPDRWDDWITRPLFFSEDSFYGRKTELSILQRSFDAMMEGHRKPCVLVVSGFAGSGKTALLKQLIKPLKNFNGYMIHCKFTQTDSPDTILTAGFDSFFEHLIGEGIGCVNDEIKMCIEAIGEHIVALEESIPHLRAFMGRQGFAGTGVGDPQALKLKLKFLLSHLVYAISSQSHPIVLVFEDLQWADEDTLDTIQLIMTDTKIRYCLFCMSYRDMGVGPKLHEMTQFLQDQGVMLLSVKLGSMEKESVDCLVSETLRMPLSLIEPLSCVVRNKTGGVILFIINFLKSLHEEGCIYFNLTSVKWEFDLDKIIEKEIPADVVDFLSELILRLPEQIQSGLKIAACLGSSFDLIVFQKANKSPDYVTNDFVSLVTENGFLHKSSPNILTWSHSQLQEAAYALIPMNKRPSMHLLIGARIYLGAGPEEVHQYIHDIVKNMNIGMSQLDSQERKTELAQLNLAAGDQSKKTLAFYSAANYYMTGVDLLDEDWPNTSYELAMKLFNSATEMLIITGHIERFEAIIEKPLNQARNFEDRLPAYFTSIRYMCISGSFEEALATCFSVMSELGEDFPANATPEIIAEEISELRQLLTDFPTDDLLDLPRLADPTQGWMMKIMATTMLILFSTKPDLAPLIGCRMTQRSAIYGWCPDSAFGLYSYGQALISLTKEVEEGCSWVKIGLALLRDDNEQTRLPVLEALYHEFISFWKEPIQATCEALTRIHQEALFEGQMEFSMSAAFHSCRHSFMSGTSLEIMNYGCTAVTNKMVQLKQMWSVMFHVSLHCLILKLMGHDDVSQAFAPVNSAMNNEEQLLQLGLSTGKNTLVQYVYLYRMILAYWLQNYDEAAEMAALYGTDHMRFLDIYHIFYEGLTALRLAKNKDAEENRWISVGEKAVATFQVWEGYSNWNFENKYLLLLAELHSVNGDHNIAEEKYKASIVSAQEHRFLHEEGLATELFGIFYEEIGKTERSVEMFAHARACYEKWGANALVARLDSRLN